MNFATGQCCLGKREVWVRSAPGIPNFIMALQHFVKLCMTDAGRTQMLHTISMQ